MGNGSKTGSRNFSKALLPPSHAGEVHAFYQAWFNPYLNYHRPCGFATVKTDAKGKAKKVYDVYATPYERLKSLPQAQRFLKRGVTFAALDRIARQERRDDVRRDPITAARRVSRIGMAVRPADARD